MGNLSKLLGPMLDSWAQEAKEERSRTWKERHAKGVPVTMTLPEWMDITVASNWQINHSPSYNTATNEFSISVYREGADPVRTTEKPVATFCNFRYKLEWLEKKKIIVCSNEPPPAQHRGGVTEW